MRIAAIDVGSNSIHLVVVETDAMGGQRVLAREKAMVRLAKGGATSGRIEAGPFRAGLEALQAMARTVADLECATVMACGTAALRDAEKALRLGIPIQVISGEEEARLIHLAVSHAIPFPEAAAALVDIGGGSTEITWVRGASVLASTSLPWGLQRLADAVPTANPPAPEDLRRLKKFIAKALRKARKALPPDLPGTPQVLGTSGTFEDLARGASGGPAFTLGQLEPFRRRLWHADARGRVERLGVDPKRAEVLHVGATWASALLKWLGATEVRCLGVGLREGMIWEALRHGGVAIPPLADRRRASVEAFAARLDPDPGHSLHVQALCDQLFDGLMPSFELGDTEREWLAAAARLHDIGFSLSEKGHHKHGAYLVRNAPLQGFWPEEVEIIAQVVRHHRGKAPDPVKHEAFRQLAPWHQATVAKLTAILRVADALDRRRRQAVKRVRVEDSGEALCLVVEGHGDLAAEAEAFREKGRLLMKLLDRPLGLALG
jgi:exopolyphosphatase/guanosine-5'-triphosphate,3'-diphosphate pyrophosphatase